VLVSTGAEVDGKYSNTLLFTGTVGCSSDSITLLKSMCRGL